ncbi:MAG: LysM peptidoglycan-binding domain-containing protein [Parachlamydiaceae bacterium]|nr:LysM peptidoglycan-binding domain-containing protein [Parachlamydiaceae bacterium]
MTRKDTILVAVIINAGLLAILFATAVIYDSEGSLVQNEASSQMAVNKAPVEEATLAIASTPAQTGDEVDNVLNFYANPSQPIVVETSGEIFTTEAPVASAQEVLTQDTSGVSSTTQNEFVEVTVKKGDVLEKIARNNGTTISAIKKANQLKNEKLKIGQVLKIPQKKDDKVAVATTSETPKKVTEKTSDNESSEPVYYVIKSGDSPWKVARQNNVNYEDILKLNSMSEEKARNLKIGDKIRIK